MLHAHIQYQHLTKLEHLIRPLLNQEVVLTTGQNIAPDTQVLVTEHCTAAQLDQLEHLRRVLLPCAGLPATIRDNLKSRTQIKVHNLHYNHIAVAENALALLLAASKRILPLDQSLRQGYWTPTGINTEHAMLFGSRCLLLGYGAIGQALAPILTALGIELSVMKRRPDPALIYPCYTADNWQTVLSDTDILISSLPGTPATQNLIDQEVLAKLPDHAVFINVGRGSCVDERALFEALQQKTIGAAGLDVWWNYPSTYPFESDDQASPCFPSQYPYQKLDNLVMLPHRGSDHRMKRLQEHLISMLCERINQLSLGQAIPNQVNLSLGY